MMHGRGKMGFAPTFDGARRGLQWAMPLLTSWCRVHFFFYTSRFALPWAETAETHQFRSFWCRTDRFKPKFKKRKEKEKVQNAPFELNNKTLNYLSSQPNSFFNLQLSHSLCPPIPSQLSALHLPSLKDALSHSLRHILTLLFFAWLSVSSSPQVSSSPHLTDPLSTKVSN